MPGERLVCLNNPPFRNAEMPTTLRPTLLAVALAVVLPFTKAALAEETTPADPAAPSDQAAPADGATGDAPKADGERAPLEERSVEGAAALERQLPAGEQQMLQAGNERFLALWKPANAGEATGVVILIPGSGETADWPQAIGPLRNKLPDHGWSSLSLTLPDRQPVPVDTPPAPSAPAGDAAPAAAPADAADPAATTTGETPADATDIAADPPAAPTTVDPAERMFARIDAGIALAREQKAKAIVLLGHGEGAYWAARYLKEKKPPQVLHLVAVGAVQPSGLTPPLEELLPNVELVTGDFFYKDQNSDRSAATRRLQASKRVSHKAYTQVGLKAMPGNREAEQEQLYRRIRGWLDKVLPGAK